MIIRINKTNEIKVKDLNIDNKTLTSIINDFVTIYLNNVTKVFPREKVTNNKEIVTNNIIPKQNNKQVESIF